MPHSASHACCAMLMEGAVMQRVCNIADCIMQSTIIDRTQSATILWIIIIIPLHRSY